MPVDRRIEVTREGNVALLTLRHPPGNRITQAMLQDLGARVADLEKDAAVGAVIVTGAGGAAFSDGLEAAEWASFSPKDAQAAIERGFAALWALEHLTKPTIAAIEGACRGAGAELALACDLRFASRVATFAFPDVDRGWMPSHGGVARLPRMIGRARALELFLTGSSVTAWEAAEMGFVERVVEPGQALATARETAATFAKKPRAAAHAIKRALTEGEEKPYRNRFLLETQHSVQLLGTDAYRETQERERRKAP